MMVQEYLDLFLFKVIGRVKFVGKLGMESTVRGDELLLLSCYLRGLGLHQLW